MSFVDNSPPLFDNLLIKYITDIFTYFPYQVEVYDRDAIKDLAIYYNAYLSDHNIKYLKDKVLSFKKDKNINFIQYLLNSKHVLPIQFNEIEKKDIILRHISSYLIGDIDESEITEKDYSEFAEFFSFCHQKFPLYLTLFNQIYDEVIFNPDIDLITEYINNSEKKPKITYNTLLVLELEEYLFHQIPIIETDIKQNPSSDLTVDSLRILLFQVMSKLSTLVINEVETHDYLRQFKEEYIKNEVNFFLLSKWIRKMSAFKNPVFNYAYNWLVQDTNQRTPVFPMQLADSSSQAIEDAYFVVVNRAKKLSNGLTNASEIELPKIVSSKIDHSFDSLTSQVKKDYILQMLEELSITVNGKSILSIRKKGALRGVVEALRDNNILPNIGLESLCQIIADKIDLDLNSKLDWSKTVDEYKKKAKQYIKINPLS